MEIILSRKFIKQAKKLTKSRASLRDKIDDCIIDFSNKIFKSKYYRKKLKGYLTGLHELEVGGDIRIIIKIAISKDSTVFEQIGTHSELY